MFEVDPQLVIPDPDLSLEDGAIAPWSKGHNQYFKRLVESVAEDRDIPMDQPWGSLDRQHHDLLL